MRFDKPLTVATEPHRITCAREILIACVLFLSAVGRAAYGQTPRLEPSVLPGEICRHVYRNTANPKGCADTSAPVLEAPFAATIVTEFEGGKAGDVQQFARDSKGRTRTVNSRGFIDIDDPVSHFRIGLDPNTLHAIRWPTVVSNKPPVGKSGGTNTDAILGVPIIEEYLGVESVDGLHVQRYRVSWKYSAGGDFRCIAVPHIIFSDYWYSPELRITIVTRDFDSRYGVSTTRFTNMSRAEPDPALFQVPPEYTTVGISDSFAMVLISSGVGTLPKQTDKCPEFAPPPNELR